MRCKQMKGLYSGRQIKNLATKKAKITRSQTAAQAVKAIVKKYGSVSDSGKYHHTGKGVWVKYSLANDSKRTGKLAASKAQWRAQPHKLDYHGIDTKKGVEKKEVKAVKPKFSLSSIKPPAKLSSRTKKTPAKMVHKSNTFKILPKIELEYIKRAGRSDSATSRIKTTDPVKAFKLFMQSKSINKDSIYVTIPNRASGIFEIRNLMGWNESYGNAIAYRKFLDATGLDEYYSAYHPDIDVFKTSPTLAKNIKSKMVHKAAVKSIPKKVPSPVRRRYASFSRPLGSWFNPGVHFKYEDTRASDKDFRYNRMPHTVISTETMISPEKIKSYELVDLAEGRKMQALINYSNAVRYFTDGMKDQVERQILKGAIATKKDIEPYIAKAKKIMEKKEGKKPSSSSKFSVAKLRQPGLKGRSKSPQRMIHTTKTKTLNLSEPAKIRVRINKLKTENAQLTTEINSDKYDWAGSKYTKPQRDRIEANNKEIKMLENTYEFKTNTGAFAPKKAKKPKQPKKSPEFARRDKLQALNIKIDELKKSIAFDESHGSKPITDIQTCNRLIKQRDKMLGIAPIRVDKKGQYVEKTPKERAISEAHEDWDNQAKAKLMYNREFRDKSLKACIARHVNNI